MNRNINAKFFGIILTFFIVTICFSGCTEKYNVNEVVENSEFIGTWFGNMEIDMFSFRDNTSNVSIANITELKFTKDTLYMNLVTNNGTMTMTNSYTVEGNQINLSFMFDGEKKKAMKPPFGTERPQFNGERPQDWETPFDGKRSFNESQPFRSRSYKYRFEANNSILYLDEFPFLRIK